MSKPMKQLSVSLKPETIKSLEKTAKKWNEKSISAMIRYMVEVYVEYKIIRFIEKKINDKTIE